MHYLLALLRSLFGRPQTCPCGRPVMVYSSQHPPLCAACGAAYYERLDND